MSAAQAHDRPAPAHGPFTAAMVTSADRAGIPEATVAAHDRPAPAHGPFTAAMVTLGIPWRSSEARVRWRISARWEGIDVPAASPAAFELAIALRSPPAQKPRPAPVRRTQRT